MLRYAQVNVEGRAIRYATEGSGPPLLLLHGPPLDHQMWAPTIPYLVGRFRVVAPDLPGLGGSMPLEGEQPEQLVRAIAGLVTALRMVPCAVAGASLGGGVALGLAARYPERVTALVGVGALGLSWWPESGPARLARSARLAPGLLGLAMQAAPRRLARGYLAAALSDTYPADTALVDQAAAEMRSPTSRRTQARMLARLDAWRALGRQLGAVRAPTLLVWGERDQIYGLPAAERLRHAIPGAALATLAGAGHLLSIERPAELAELMRSFLVGRS